MFLPPKTLNGNRLRWWNRVRWFVGVKPFHRCPKGRHRYRNLYGDALLMRSGRVMSECRDCMGTWPKRWGNT